MALKLQDGKKYKDGTGAAVKVVLAYLNAAMATRPVTWPMAGMSKIPPWRQPSTTSWKKFTSRLSDTRSENEPQIHPRSSPCRT